MKTSLFKIVLLALVVISFNACKKKARNKTSSKITLQIDNGTERVYTDISASVLVDKLVIGGQDDDSDVEIILDKNIGTGTYNQHEVGISHGVRSVAVFHSLSNVTSLSFVVSSHNTNSGHIKGTFTLNYDDNHSGAPHTASGSYNVYYSK